jgi:hypothetical protein
MKNILDACNKFYDEIYRRLYINNISLLVRGVSDDDVRKIIGIQFREIVLSIISFAMNYKPTDEPFNFYVIIPIYEIQYGIEYVEPKIEEINIPIEGLDTLSETEVEAVPEIKVKENPIPKAKIAAAIQTEEAFNRPLIYQKIIQVTTEKLYELFDEKTKKQLESIVEQEKVTMSMKEKDYDYYKKETDKMLNGNPSEHVDKLRAELTRKIENIEENVLKNIMLII